MSTTRIVILAILFIASLFVGYQWFKVYEAQEEPFTVSSTFEFIDVETPEEIVAIVEEPEPFVEAVATFSPQEIETDRIAELFNIYPPKLDIVETVTYKSKVPWRKGRPAWISDYANHYKTHKHFIARSLSGKADYNRSDIKDGDRFNVLKGDKEISFHLLLDLSAHRLFLSYIDHDEDQKGLLKSYPVSVGRLDASRSSGTLTPTGTYSLGDRVTVYDAKTKGYYQGEKMDLIRVFGTRWIPFQDEIRDCTAPARSYGIHGVPWTEDPITGELKEDLTSIGRNESDGCIRLKTADIEELFAIITTRPCEIEIVERGIR